MSYNRSKVAVVDEDHRVIVYELRSEVGEGSATATATPAIKAPTRSEAAAEEPALIGRAGRRGQKGVKKELASADPMANMTNDDALKSDVELSAAMKAAASNVQSAGGGRILFSEPNAVHVAFNDEIDGMLAYNGEPSRTRAPSNFWDVFSCSISPPPHTPPAFRLPSPVSRLAAHSRQRRALDQDGQLPDPPSADGGRRGRVLAVEDLHARGRQATRRRARARGGRGGGGGPRRGQGGG